MHKIAAVVPVVALAIGAAAVPITLNPASGGYTPKFTCTKVKQSLYPNAKYLGALDTQDFKSFNPNQVGGTAQPYLNFFPHYSLQNSDGGPNAPAKEAVLTTSGPVHGTANTVYITMCSSSGSAGVNSIVGTGSNAFGYGQIVIGSGPNKGMCVTASNPGPSPTATFGTFTYTTCDYSDSQLRRGAAAGDTRPSISSLQLFDFDMPTGRLEHSVAATLAYPPDGFGTTGSPVIPVGQNSYSEWVYKEAVSRQLQLPSMYIVPEYTVSKFHYDATPLAQGQTSNLPTTHGAQDN